MSLKKQIALIEVAASPIQGKTHKEVQTLITVLGKLQMLLKVRK